MKKRSKLLRSVSCLLCAALAAPSAAAAPLCAGAETNDTSAEYFVRGDVINNDGVTGLDALEVQRNEAGLVTLTDKQLLAADANYDSNVNMADVVEIIRFNITAEVRSYTGEYFRYDSPTVPEFDADSPSMPLTKGVSPSGVSYKELAGQCPSFRMNAQADGNYKIRIRYANGSGQPANLLVNATKIVNSIETITELAPTGGSDVWEDAVVILPLDEGEHYISFLRPDSTGEILISNVWVDRCVNYPDEYWEPEVPQPDTTTSTAEETTSTTTTSSATTTQTTTTTTETTTTTTTTAPAVPVRYYAVDADYYDGWSEDTNAGFAGTAYFNYNNAIGSYVDWTVDVPEDGSYAVTFRYANGSDIDRQTKVMVNGEHNECLYLDFAGTGAWTTWAEDTVVLDLKAGKNTIKARATTSGGGPNMDYIEVVKTDSAPAALVKASNGKTMENLNRGVAAAYTGSGNLVSWRLLADDNENTTFNLWRIRDSGNEMLGTFTMKDASNYFDKDGTATDWYTIDTYVGDECTEFANASVNFTAKNTGTGGSGAYFDIPTQTPAGGTTPDGVEYTYSENDCSVGDVDGDGQYEIFVKWDPSNSKDNANNGYTGSVIIDCYKLDGTLLWRIDLGKNIRAGAHYTQFMVYDFDLDGKAEMICKTADGTKDGKGNVIGNASADYRNDAGRILSGPEYLTLFDGATGAALDTINYKPGRGTVGDWGDTWGNRVDRFVACVAYLDGTRPSAVFGRGYYTRLTQTAYNVVNKKLVEVWAFDTGNNSSAAGYGDGNHHSMAADVDGDGRDEVVCGSAVIDDNGKLLYTSGMAHGDAIHIGDFVPSNPGVEIFQCLEDETHPNGTAIGFGIVLRDGKTGKVLFRETAGGDTGRAIADNLIAGNDGAEMAGSHNAVLYDCVTGKQMIGADGTGLTFASITKWGQNSVVYWTDVLERAVLDRTMADQYGKGRVFTGDGVTYNNYSKSNACLTADILGDWREEMIFRKSDGTGLRVFTTTFSTQYNVYCLMQNPQYRVQVAAQNNGYNQPPHTDYFLGTGSALPVAPEIQSAG